MVKKFYVTTPIYYVNDKPHLGHAYTTLAADVLARYHRSLGDDVFFLTGTDEHGDKVAASAMAANLEIQEFVDENAKAFESAFRALDISNDIFMRTTLPSHADAVHKFIDKLYKANALYKGTYEGLYCRGCEDFYTEKDLVDGKCPIHKTSPELVKEDNWFFHLEEYLPKVRALIETNALRIEPEARRNEVLALIDQGLNNFSITRQRVEWGIPFPYEDGQKIYVWVEALMNYVSAIGYGADEAEYTKWWPADLHLMAKDILKFHAVYWPAMLLAAGEELPRRIFAHGFFTLNGTKMSKSLGNVLDPNDLIAKYGVDATRFLLLSQFRFGSDGDIRPSVLAEQYEAHLVNGLGNLVARTAKMIEQYCDGQVDRTLELDQQSTALVEKYQEEMTKLHLQGALTTIQSFVTAIDEEIDAAKPWVLVKTDEAGVRNHLSRWAKSLLALAGLVEPFLPETGKRIREAFSAEKITKGEGLFPRLKLESR